VAQKYYIQIPLPGGRVDYVEIDPSRLHLGVLTTIFERMTGVGRDKQNKFRQAQGVEHVVKTCIDPTCVIESCEDLIGQIEIQLIGHGPAGEKVRQDTLSKLDFVGLIRAIAEGDLNKAKTAINDILYVLMTGFNSLAESIHSKEKEVGHLTAAVDGYSGLVKESGGVTHQFYFDWSEAIEIINTSVSDLKRIEALIRTKLKAHEDIARAWQTTLNDENSSLQNAVWELDGYQNESAFLTLALVYMSGESDVTFENIQAACRAARAQIADCQAREARVREQWQSFHQVAQRIYDEHSSRVKRLCAELGMAYGKFFEFEGRLKDTGLKPYQYSETQSCCSEEQFVNAKSLTSQGDWSARTAEHRLIGLLNSLSTVLGRTEPKLPRSLCAIISRAESSIKQIALTRHVKIMAEKSVSSAETTLLSIPSIAPKSSVVVAVSDSGNCDPVRTQELFEIMLCVAYYATCKFNPACGSNVKSLLLIAVELDLCDVDEVNRYSPVINELRKSVHTLEKLSDRKQVTPRWKVSGAHWLTYDWKTGDHRIKMTKSAGVLVKPLLEKYNLLERGKYTAARKASQEKKDIARAERKQRKEE
jgi:hypothetical protein